MTEGREHGSATDAGKHGGMRAGAIVVVGDIVTDVLAVPAGPLAAGSDTAAMIRILAGGSAANTAAWLAAEGADATLCGVVGDDPAGTARVAELTGLGVRCAVRRVSGAATGSVVVLSSGAERTMLCDRAANALLTAADVDVALAAVPNATHLHLSGYALFDRRCAPAGRHALAAARAAGLTTSVDAASAAPLARLGPAVFRNWVRDVDLLLANLDEARVLAGPLPTGPGLAGPAVGPAALATALVGPARRVVVKCGADGAVWAGLDAAEPVTVAAVPVPAPVDPTGAGDAFAAGLLAAWSVGAEPAVALAAGARLGALAVAAVGGRPTQPAA